MAALLVDFLVGFLPAFLLALLPVVFLVVFLDCPVELVLACVIDPPTEFWPEIKKGRPGCFHPMLSPGGSEPITGAILEQ